MMKLYIVGCLDVDIIGLVFLIDDGKWLYCVIFLKYYCEKIYLVILVDFVEDFYVEKLVEGILLCGEKELCLFV